MRYHTVLPVVGAAILTFAVAVFVNAFRADREHLEPTMGEYPEPFLRWNATRLVSCKDDVTIRAAYWWTRQLCPHAIRCSEFTYANVWRNDSYGAENDIVLAYDDDAGAAFSTEHGGHVVYWIPAPGTIDQEFRAIVHELGHALGLAHDPGDSMSPMYPKVMPNKPLILSRKDREALKATYCP